ncbi:hypothetical protein [Saccharothrix australiensis]|nr:hypothetical protein [Saccharothrix australiensis]
MKKSRLTSIAVALALVLTALQAPAAHAWPMIIYKFDGVGAGAPMKAQ